MIREAKVYQAECDNCGKTCMNKEGFVWSEERLAIEDALYMGLMSFSHENGQDDGE